jgi:multicomponent Na+:H+ antiporter subunit A
MLGAVLADDLILLCAFWELTSLASFFLIGYRHDTAEARAAATQALIVTAVGGVAMLAGFVLLAQAGGSWQISALVGKAAQIVAGGLAALVLASRVMSLHQVLTWASTGLAYDRLYEEALRGAKRLTDVYLTGRARDYYAYIVLFAVVLLGYGIASTGIIIPPSVGGVEPGPLISVAIAIIAALAAARLGLLVAAILALGVTGYSVSVVYLLLSAPDIAITQAVVETVSLILFLVALTALARAESGYQPRPVSDAALAVAAGGISIILAGMIEAVSGLPRISEQFIARAGEAGGKNIVNLIVVDFRGWDTMGEIGVLAIAALGILALAPWRRLHPPAAHGPRRGSRDAPRVPPPAEAPMTSVILRTIATVASPIIIAYAVLLWATGHYGPGGGFVAGLMFAAAIVLRAEAFGIGRLNRRWDLLIVAGLLLAAGSAAVPLAVGAPLLKHTLVEIGGRTFASSLIFDLGVFCLVAGAALAAVCSLSEAA